MRFLIATLCLSAATSVLSAQTPAPHNPNAWKTSDVLGKIDMSGLTAVQKKAVMKVLREQDCSCLCGMKAAECANEDPDCSYSKKLAAIAIQGVKDGKTLLEISKQMDASPKAHRPKLLEDPVTIPVAGSPMRGPADARITLVEFSDFECPYCSIAVKKIAAIMATYSKDVKLVYKQYPLSMHPHAQIAAQAALAANAQGKFWEMHDVLFANSRILSRDHILAWAEKLGLDMDKFKADLDSPKVKQVIDQDMKDGDAAGVYGTPAIFIDGKLYNGELELASVKPILEAELKGGAKTKVVAKADHN